MRKFNLLFALLILLGGYAQAQSKLIRGMVTDSIGRPLANVTVQVLKSKTGTTTDNAGRFAVQVPNSNSVLVFSTVGYQSVEENIGDRNELTISLQTVQKSLQEVVVVAYGTQKKSELTSAISTVNAEAIKSQQVVSVGQALQGTAPGVLVVNTSGQPGDNPIIRIRGVASIGASADPLIVLDGVPFDGNLNMISPNDIDNFSILKDAAASALYGSRAANGVILINTKMGKKNAAPSITVSGVYGVSSRAIPDYPYLNTQQLFELGWEGLKNTYAASANPAVSSKAAQLATQNLIKNGFHYNPYGITQPVDTTGHLVPGANLLWNDNWTKALQRDQAARRDVNLGISGGGDKSRYFFSAGYLDQDGYIARSNFQRVSARLNYNTDLKSWLQVGARVSLVSSKQNYPNQGSGAYSDVVQYGRTLSSVFPIYARSDSGQVIKDASGNPVFDFGKPDPTRKVNVNRPVLQPSNVVATLYLDNWTYDRLLTDFNTYGQVNFTKNLYFKSTFGINRYLLNQLHYENKDFGDASTVGGRTYREEDLTTSWTWNNMLDYENRFGDHHVEAMASYEAYKYYFETMYGSKTGFAFGGQQQLSNAATAEDFEGYTISSTLLSALGRIKYDYKGKYFVEATARRDGSSIFAPGYRYGWFPAAGVSWLLSNEDFIKNIKTVNLLKLRASYGELGNNALLDGSGNRSYFPYLSTYSSGYNDLTNPGVYLSQLANNNIQWEKQVTANIGIDFELFKDRLSGSVDLFQKNSKNLILNEPLPPSSGFGSVITNIGKVQNAGIELNLDYRIIHQRDFNLNVLFNITYLKNKIISLLPGKDTFATSGAFRNVVGKSIFEYYLPVWAGVDPKTGGGLWWTDEKDANGNPTGKQVTTTAYTTALNSQKWVGSGLPKYTGGFTTRFNYKNVDVNLLLNYSFGGKYYDNNYAGLMEGLYSGYGAQMSVDELSRWQKPGDVTDVPRLKPNNNDEAQLSTRFLFSSDYIRVRNITVGYTFKPNASQNVFKNIRLYVQGDNLFTWDKLKKGSDPESAINGFASGNAVVFKTLSAGVDFNF